MMLCFILLFDQWHLFACQAQFIRNHFAEQYRCIGPGDNPKFMGNVNIIPLLFRPPWFRRCFFVWLFTPSVS